MIEDIDFNTEENTVDEKLKVIFVVRVGKTPDNQNIYHLLCKENIDEVWCEEWGEVPACACRHLQPEEGEYTVTVELKTDIDFVLGQENCCCSYQDVCDGCIAMAYENINGYEEYPSPRLIFYYGQELDDIEKELAKRDLVTKMIKIS